MQTSQQQNEKTTNILHVEGYSLMYHKLIWLSMKWVKKLKAQKKHEKCQIDVKRDKLLELLRCFDK